jgi:CRP-like cAMP-binding protein
VLIRSISPTGSYPHRCPSQDVYVKATLVSSAEDGSMNPFSKTKAVRSATGDEATVWRRDDDNRLALAATAADRKLQLEVWSKGILRDELLASSEIELPEVLPSDSGPKQWVELASGDAKVQVTLMQGAGARVSVAPQLLDATLSVSPLRAWGIADASGLVGRQDPYVRVRLVPESNISASTPPAPRGGATPEWEAGAFAREAAAKSTAGGSAGAGAAVPASTAGTHAPHPLTLGVSPADECLVLEVWNSNVGPDTLIGSAELPLSTLPLGASRHELDTGGTLEVNIVRSFDGAQFVGKTLLVQAHEARKLLDVQLLGSMDPFVRATLLPSGTVQKTGYAPAGGVNPRWDQQQFNTLELPVQRGDLALRLDVLNWRLVDDDLIGSCTLPLTAAALKPGKMAWRTLQVAGSAGSTASDGSAAAAEEARLHMTIRVQDDSAGELTGRAVCIDAHCGRCLQSAQMLGAQDPYVVARVLRPGEGDRDARTSHTSRTLASEGGGTDPKWAGVHNNHLVLPLTRADEGGTVLLEVWNENVVSDDKLGEVEVEIPHESVGQRTAERSMLQLCDDPASVGSSGGGSARGTLEITVANIESDESAGFADDQELMRMALVKRAQARRSNVRAVAVDLSAGFTAKVVPKEDAQRDAICAALASEHCDAHIFDDVQPAEFKMLAESMELVECSAGDVIIEQGHSADDAGDQTHLYVMEEGCFDVEVDGTKVAELIKPALEAQSTIVDIAVGEARPHQGFFGELALIHDAPRAATIRATSSARLWRLDRSTFRFVLATSSQQSKEDAMLSLKSVELNKGGASRDDRCLFADFTEEQLAKVAEASQLMDFVAGETLITKGTIGNVFYMVKTGTLVVSDFTMAGGEEAEPIELGPGQYFGERALLHSEPRQATVTAKTDVTCLLLDRTAFVELLGPVVDVLRQNVGLETLRLVPQLAALTEEQRQQVFEQLERRRYAKGEYVIRQDEVGDRFYIIYRGRAAVLRQRKDGTSEELAVLQEKDYFGELALLNADKRQASIVAQRALETFELHRDAFERLLGPVRELMVTNAADREREQRTGGAGAKGKLEKMAFDEIEVLRTLGTGMFGRVKLVQHKATGATYALKQFQKAQIVAYGQQKNVIQEKNIMLSTNHPFILSIVATFKDKNCLYMMLELIQVRKRWLECMLWPRCPTECIANPAWHTAPPLLFLRRAESSSRILGRKRAARSTPRQRASTAAASSLASNTYTRGAWCTVT